MIRKIITGIWLLVWLAGCVAPLSNIAGLEESMAVGDAGTGTGGEGRLPATGDIVHEDDFMLEQLQGMSPRETYRELDRRRLFSLSLREARLKNALALLSGKSGVPIVARPGVEGTVTVNLRDKSLGEILYAILEPLGYTATVDRGIILVEEPKLVSRTFCLTYIKDKRTSSSVTNASVTSGSGTSTGSTATVSAGVVSTGTNSSSSSTQGNVSVTTEGISDFWDGIRAGLETIVFGTTSSGGGSALADDSGRKLVVNEMAGIIYVTDYSTNIGNVSDFLSRMEQAVKRQVLIQAHIVEVSLDESFDMGLDWELILNKNNNRQWRLAQELVSSPASRVFQLQKLNSDDFTLLMDAMREQGRINMLSSPKISTLNNQKAVIKLTTQEVTWVNTAILTADGNTLESFTTPQIDEVGLFLDVTPSIDDSGRITMQIHPSISEIKEVSVSPDNTSSKPVINVREVDTIAHVKAGQTVVIAGLITDRFRRTRRHVPVVGSLPVVGNLFSNYHQERVKAELVIFLTPYLLDDRSMNLIRTAHESRLKKLREIDRLVEPGLPGARKDKLQEGP